MILFDRRSAVVLFLTLALVPLHAATLSRQSADVFSQKIALILERGDAGEPARTRLTEDEVNSWFLYHGERWQPLLPAGVDQPQLTIIGEGQVAAQAMVNLDAVAKRRSSGGGSLDPLSLLGGTVPVKVLGVLHSQEGQGRFEVQSAEVSGIPVPATVLQQLLGYYSRTPEQPEGLRLDQTFQLPAGIRQVEIGRGQAVVVQ